MNNNETPTYVNGIHSICEECPLFQEGIEYGKSQITEPGDLRIPFLHECNQLNNPFIFNPKYEIEVFFKPWQHASMFRSGEMTADGFRISDNLRCKLREHEKQQVPQPTN